MSVLNICVSGNIRVWAKDDFQYWSQYEIAKQLGSQWEIFYSPEFRLRENASQLFFHRHRQGVRWKPFPYLQAGVHYFFSRTQPLRGRPRWEHRGELEITPSYTWKNLTGSLRSRAELREIQGNPGEEEWHFRFMPKLSYYNQTPEPGFDSIRVR